MRTFESVLVVDCPFSVAWDYVRSYMLRFADRRQAIAVVQLPLRAFGLPIPGSLPHRVQIAFEPSIDASDRNRSHEGFTFQWDSGNALLPQLRGTLSFRIAGDRRTELVLTGEYATPPGRLGNILDRFVGNRIAVAIGKALLERMGSDMELREQEFEAAHARPGVGVR